MKYLTAVVGVVIRKINKKPHVLVCRRNEPRCKEAHLKWEIPGGKVEMKETLLETVEREVFEETGIRCRPVKLLQSHTNRVWKYSDEDRWVLAFAVQCEYIGGEIVSTDEHVGKPQWMPVQNALKLNLLYGIKEKIEEGVNDLYKQ